ncbi:hypothetical protein [Aurantivibrio plasticivorans]
MIILAFLVAMLVFVFAVIIHLLYRYVFRRGKYEGITFLEVAFISVGSVPGLAGCAIGWAGFGFPLPLIIGLPLNLIFLGNKECGWWPPLMLNDLQLISKFASLFIAWFLANLLVVGVLFYFKKRSA